MRNMNGQKTLTPEEKALWQRAIDVLVSAGFTAETLTDYVLARFLKHAGDAEVRNAQTAQRASQGHGTGRSQNGRGSAVAGRQSVAMKGGGCTARLVVVTE